MAKEEIRISSFKALKMFLSGRTCSEMLFNILSNSFDDPKPEEEKASLSLAGGIKQHGYQCGMIWGSALAAGSRAYQLNGPGELSEAIAVMVSKKVVDAFERQNDYINCEEITHLDKSSTNLETMVYFLLKGGTIGCAKMAARFAPLAQNEINIAFLEDDTLPPSSPVSCASLLAKKMGASTEHITMVAGLAGGIGLCGGGCGALGTAIWLLGLKSQAANESIDLWKDKELTQKYEGLIQTFLKSSDYEFECADIVGRKFEDVNDHSAYLKNGGCKKIIDALVESQE